MGLFPLSLFGMRDNRRSHVLLASADEPIRRIFAFYLDELPCSITTAPSLIEIEKHARGETQVDLVLADTTLFRSPYEETLARILDWFAGKKTFHLFVVEEDKAEAMKYACRDLANVTVVTKPIEVFAFRQLVGKVLQEKERIFLPESSLRDPAAVSSNSNMTDTHSVVSCRT